MLGRQPVDYISWCDRVLATISEIMKANSVARGMGVDREQAGRILLPEDAQRPDFWSSESCLAVLEAMLQLEKVGLIESDQHKTYFKITQMGREYLRDPIPFWSLICSSRLEPDQEQLLRAINKSSPVDAGSFMKLNYVTEQDLDPPLDWTNDRSMAYGVARDLENLGFINEIGTMGGSAIEAASVYAGLVWTTRQGETRIAQFIDDLRQDGETTSVDFKRDIHLESNDEKAEFVKDIIALANTQASGKRWLVVGFDKQLNYFGSPSSGLKHERMEQILSEYMGPVVNTCYEVVDYRSHAVGLIEILRDATQLPYAVKKSLAGATKRIIEGTIYVRHGSITAIATSEEVDALRAEATRVRTSRGVS